VQPIQVLGFPEWALRGRGRENAGMSVVRINAITVPPERADMLVERFANRAGEVSKMEGFEAFELLRPTDGKDVFYVYTRWRSTEDFERWLNSQAFGKGHAQHNEQGPAGTGSDLLSFDVVQEEYA
jgi:heme-degrading monooxygenase HmoA